MIERMKKKLKESWVELAVTAAVSAALLFFFISWWVRNPPTLIYDKICSLTSLTLFLGILIRLMPGWVKAVAKPEKEALPQPETVRFAYLKVFLLFLGSLVLHTAISCASRLIDGADSELRNTFYLFRGLDANTYYYIAKYGYTQYSEAGDLLCLVFFPGYPILTGIFMMVIPNEVLCGYLSAWLPFLASGPVLYKLLRLDHSHRETMGILLLFCLAPAAVFYAYPMSESLFILCAAGCLYLARTKRWFASGVVGLCAAFTRSLGILLLVPLAMEWWRQFRTEENGFKNWKPWLKRASCMLFLPAGLVLYLYINYIHTGDPLIFLQYQKNHWSQQLSWFFSTSATQSNYMYHACMENNVHSIFGLWVPNLAVGYASLLIMLIAGKKLRPDYSLWFMFYFAVSYGATWLLSGPRYMSVFFPLAIAAYHLPIKRKWIIFLFAVPPAFAYTVMFALRWSIW